MEKEFLGYHGTSSERTAKIKKHGFIKSNSKSSLPGDLGFGAYFYISRNDNDVPFENASKYVKNIKTRYEDYVIIETVLSIEQDKILDLNDVGTKDVLEEFIEKNYDKIISSAEKYKRTPAYKRGNFDGVALNIFIKLLGLSVDAAIQDTYTNFDGLYKSSNFKNGREICVKNINIIDLSNLKVTKI